MKSKFSSYLGSDAYQYRIRQLRKELESNSRFQVSKNKSFEFDLDTAAIDYTYEMDLPLDLDLKQSFVDGAYWLLNYINSHSCSVQLKLGI